ncbi:MAG: hypothetical protein LIP02_03755 [Bacteroidales bacterium]|nr:hypothetical protein [Bacteroidales bacterium]
MKLLNYSLTLLMALAGWSGASAQSWANSFVSSDYEAEHVIYATLTVDGTAITTENMRRYQIAALIDGTLRYSATDATLYSADPTAGEGIYYYPMRVKGTADEAGQDIEFRVYDNNTALEYRLNQTLAFGGDAATTGTLSNLYALELVPVTGATPTYTWYGSDNSTLTLCVGETKAIALTLQPENASTPILEWMGGIRATGGTTYLTIDNDAQTITGVQATATDSPTNVYTYIGNDCYGWDVTVVEKINSITITDFPSELWMGQDYRMSQYMTLDPVAADASSLTVTAGVSDTGSVTCEYSANAQGWVITPVNTGSVTLTFTAPDVNDGTTPASATVSFEVKAPAREIQVVGLENNLALPTLELNRLDIKVWYDYTNQILATDQTVYLEILENVDDVDHYLTSINPDKDGNIWLLTCEDEGVADIKVTVANQGATATNVVDTQFRVIFYNKMTNLLELRRDYIYVDESVALTDLVAGDPSSIWLLGDYYSDNYGTYTGSVMGDEDSDGNPAIKGSTAGKAGVELWSMYDTNYHQVLDIDVYNNVGQIFYYHNEFECEVNVPLEIAPLLEYQTSTGVVLTDYINKDITLEVEPGFLTDDLAAWVDSHLTITNNGTENAAVTFDAVTPETIFITILATGHAPDLEDASIYAARFICVIKPTGIEITAPEKMPNGCKFALADYVKILPEGADQSFTVEVANDSGNIISTTTDNDGVLYINAASEGNATYTVIATGNTAITKDATVEVVPALTGITVNGVSVSNYNKYFTCLVGDTKTFTLSPQPEESLIDGWYTVEFNCGYVNDPIANASGKGWEHNTFTDNGDGTYTFSANLPGASCAVEYCVYDADGNQLKNGDYNVIGAFRAIVGQEYTHTSGWGWHSYPASAVTYITADELSLDMADIFGDNLQEARSASDLLYNDPTYGYFGTMSQTLSSGVMYKINLKESQAVDLYGDIVKNPSTIGMYYGWNWMVNPYPINVSLSDLYGLELLGDESMIKAHDGTFAIMNNGGWEGTLEGLVAGEGYMVKCTNEYGQEVEWPALFNLDNTTANAQMQSARLKSKGTQALWNANRAAYADNMALIAKIEGLESDRYSVGAFVGDECRGEGQLVNGLWFVGVAGDAGETVTFKVLDTLTDQITEIGGTVAITASAGTVSDPVLFTSNTTGIQSIAADGSLVMNRVAGTIAGSASMRIYNLSGQDVTGSNGHLTPGMYIVKDNGLTSKVIVR